MILRRALSAAVYACAMVGGIVYAPYSLLLGLCMLFLYELCMCSVMTNKAFVYAVVCGLMGLMGWGSYISDREVALNILWTIWAADVGGYFFGTFDLLRGSVFRAPDAGVYFVGELMFHLLPACIFFFAFGAYHGLAILCSILLLSLVSRKVSPNKSVNGYIGSFCSSFLINRLDITSIAVVVIAAALGDLYFSWIKRNLHIKDWSGMMPGHGGFIDRLDSFFGVGVWLMLCKLYGKFG